MSDSENKNNSLNGENHERSTAPQLDPDEAFCQSCGEKIKKAEICPECVSRWYYSENRELEDAEREREKYERMMPEVNDLQSNPEATSQA